MGSFELGSSGVHPPRAILLTSISLFMAVGKYVIDHLISYHIHIKHIAKEDT